MNKLITTNTGGMPFNLDDLRFDLEATRLAFNDLTQSFGGSMILWGANISTVVVGTASCTAGAVVIDGEICHVDAQSIPYTAGNEIYFLITPTYAPAGDKVFNDANSHNTHEIRKGILSSGATLPANATDQNAYRLDSIKTDIAALNVLKSAIESAWTSFNITGWTGSFKYKIIGKQMTIYINGSTTATLALNHIDVNMPTAMIRNTAWFVGHSTIGSASICRAEANSILNNIRLYKSDNTNFNIGDPFNANITLTIEIQ